MPAPERTTGHGVDTPGQPAGPVDSGGGIAAWSMRHPVGVLMMALALIVLGTFSLQRLGVDLLPHIIYPEVRIRVMDPGVPATIMEDRVTRQLEEQLAITEDAVSVQSNTREGRTSVNLSFPYGKDIDRALRDASTRLDRAKRFLPATADPPVIYKRDPSQLPIAEFAVSSTLWDPVRLREWVDYTFSRWFVNLPGVAASEVGGGLVREIQVLPDQQRLAGLGLDVLDMLQALKEGNVDTPGGKLLMDRHQITGRTAGRFRQLEEVEELPIQLEMEANGMEAVPLREIARVVDGHKEEQLRIRLNDVPAVKLTVQKQPQANTVAVADAVRKRLEWLDQQGLIPANVHVAQVSDRSVFVRQALNNAVTATLTGASLAMLVVYVFLGDLRRTLIIGSAIPIAMMVTFIIMGLGGLTLNIMTLGGLALGVGMLVDNTIVMLENIVRHQRKGADGAAPLRAAAEVNSAIVASTTTNLAAVLPFLFVGGLIGLMFRELIFTISAAIVASLLVALTLVPALAARVPDSQPGVLRRVVDRFMGALQNAYAALLGKLLRVPWLVVLAFVAAMAWTVPDFLSAPQSFLPSVDNGQAGVRIIADSYVTLDEMDEAVAGVEDLLRAQPEVQTWFASIGGFVFGRSEYIANNRASILVQLVPPEQRTRSTTEWIEQMREELSAMRIPGVRVRLRNRELPGIRLGRGEDRVSLRIQGDDLDTLALLGDTVTDRIRDIEGLRNVKHSSEDVRQEISVKVDRDRAATFGLTVEDVGDALRTALDGAHATDFIQGDRSVKLRVRLPHREMSAPDDINDVLLYDTEYSGPIRLGEVASIHLAPTPSSIVRDQQRRVVEVNASLTDDADMVRVWAEIHAALSQLSLPEGYTIYDTGEFEELREGRQLSQVLLGLALFLVLVVMAVQYESLRNPVVIMICVPFALIGVAEGVRLMELAVSMPVWLGLIMLTGIVVNNAIVLIEYVEIERRRGHAVREAIVQAARLRLRPILMTTLTTVVGMLPLAAGYGEGTELLEPLAVTIVAGLSFSTLVSLLLTPMVYRLFTGLGG